LLKNNKISKNSFTIKFLWLFRFSGIRFSFQGRNRK
jgi:hypothetical protein